LKAVNLKQAVVGAAQHADIARLQSLLAQGADVNAVWRGYRGLHALIQEKPQGDGAECLRWLLAQGADPELPGAWPPARAILVAAFSGVPAYVEALRESGAVVDAFVAAALGGDAGVAAALAHNPAFATARDPHGLTALHCCCATRMGEFTAIAQRLLDAGAEVTARAKSWNHEVDAAHFAASAKHPRIFELLLERGTDPTEALTHATWHGTLEMAGIALRHGGAPDRAVSNGRPLLNDLVRWGQFTPALWLLEQGASPNVADNEGWTAVHQAASRGNERMLRALLEDGGDRTRRDRHGMTPHDIAMTTKGRKLVRLLSAR
jgi:ankyrin repeat protein